MKKNDTLLLVAAAGYTALFYEQEPGLNLLLFSLLLPGLFVYRKPEVLKDRWWLFAALAAIVTSASVVLHGEGIAVFGNACSLLLLSAYSVNTSTSVIAGGIQSFFSVLTSAVFIFSDGFARISKANPAGRRNKGYTALLTVAVIVAAIIFFSLYRGANPLFAANTKWLNLDFVSVPWFGFLIMSTVLMYGIVHHRRFEPIVSIERRLENSERKRFTEGGNFEAEQRAGVFLFSLLNIMLLALNAGDITSFWISGVLPKGVTHADFVHRGVELLILSILLAAGIIMFLHRDDFSGIRHARVLKTLMLAWIVQCGIMVASTVYRNHLYVEQFDLTYLRIGVYVWLVLSLAGLLITWIKIRGNRSNWYLVKTNAAAWYIALVIGGTQNWDHLITRYNLGNKPLAEVDFNYLFRLAPGNLEVLLDLRDKPAVYRLFDEKKLQNRNEKGFNKRMKDEIHWFFRGYETGWRSWNYRDYRTYTKIMNP